MSEASFPPSSILSQATAQALEFPSLLAVVSMFAASDLGRERVLDLRPFEELAALRTHRTRFEEASRLVARCLRTGRRRMTCVLRGPQA